MIYTITINPSIDKHITVDRLIKDDAVRVRHMRRDPGGKGINVSRVIKELGGTTKAFGIVGGCTGYMLRDLLQKNQIDFEYVEISGETRINVIITDLSDNTQTRLSSPGPEIRLEDIEKLIALISNANPKPSFWVLGGSLPPGASVDTYKRLIEYIRIQGGRCVLDTDDEPLRTGIEAKPFMIKPNEYELYRLCGRSAEDEKEVLVSVRELCDDGIDIVVASLGKKGAIIGTKEKVLKVVPPTVKIVSKVGSGDSLIGGILVSLEKGLGLEVSARYGISAGTAAVMTEGTRLCRKEDVEDIFDKVSVEYL